MRITYKSFDNTSSYLDTDRCLRSIAVHINRFTEFRPMPFFGREIMAIFLFQPFKHIICCYLFGTFVCFLAGVYQSFRVTSLFIALTDTPFKTTFFREGVKSNLSIYMGFTFDYWSRSTIWMSLLTNFHMESSALSWTFSEFIPQPLADQTLT